MISITIDATVFDLSAYNNVKMDNFKFFGMENIPIYCGLQMSTKFSDVLSLYPG